MKGWIAAILALLVGVAPARAEELKLVTAHLPPFTMEGTDRPGFAIEMMQEVARRAGLSVSVNFRSWVRAQADAHNGSGVAILPLARTPERENRYTWVGEMFGIEVNFVDVAGKGYSLDAARSLNSVIVQEGTSFVSSLKSAGFGNLITRPDTTTNGRMLVGGRAEAWYVARLEALWVWKNAGFPGKPTIGPKVEDEKQWLALSPGADPALVERLRAAMASVIADGTRERIIRSYLE
ncbi:substrate-binding periplasmic protein [Magnetospirillum moscoviense]|uniref:Solute-binding protein family 3/N-terminal domain-containing protein n=1 Tax=Magnetospirillum moscoviense TaxID=1437059 RepID=A0A178MJD4_9PROT|nr:transporter substrate-binding domain-containing protein [Magnetospirillum moscoviense]MBF0323653.1 transporter substrate-binding domain-containing protein [Alphaproteobacteria bacterium]OAN48841.1 hypothetical protein A6A05_14225 [Magnetospirillum moscoviense]